MNGNKLFAPLVVLLIAFGVYSSTFIVKQWELALKLKLGEIVSSDYDPGLHFMVPVFNNVKIFDGRIQTLDASAERFLTVEKKDVIVDSFIKWRIADVAQYYRSTGGSPDTTGRLLQERINTALRNEFGRRTIREVVSGDRREIMQILTRDADTNAGDLGVEIVDVRIKQIDLPKEVSNSVYERMRAERERVARDLRAKGSEQAEKIQADADRQRTILLAEAYQQAEVIRGEGDGKAAAIYANAYEQNKEFFAFYRSLIAYRDVFTQDNNIMVLQPDSEFFEYFGSGSR